VSRPLSAPTALLAVVLAACGAGPLRAEDVAATAEEALEQRSGVRPEITCPKDLPARVGARMTCTLTAGGDPTQYDVEVRVRSVENDRVRFDVDVDREPKG
jgi:Domain of unknown function (DUF4333)